MNWYMAIDSTPFGEVFLAQDEFDASQVDRLCVELLGDPYLKALKVHEEAEQRKSTLCWLSSVFFVLLES